MDLDTQHWTVGQLDCKWGYCSKRDLASRNQGRKETRGEASRHSASRAAADPTAEPKPKKGKKVSKSKRKHTSRHGTTIQVSTIVGVADSTISSLPKSVKMLGIAITKGKLHNYDVTLCKPDTVLI